MNRRASLPGADELFRPTGSDRERPKRAEGTDEPDRKPAAKPRASGRTSHDTKITVYLDQQELLDLEQARLRLQAEYDVKVDRGRLVREAVAELLLDLYEQGPESAIVRKLT